MGDADRVEIPQRIEGLKTPIRRAERQLRDTDGCLAMLRMPTTVTMAPARWRRPRVAREDSRH